MCADWFFMFLWYRDHTAYYAERIFTIGWCGNKYNWDVYRMGDMEDRMQVSQNMSEWKVLILSRNNFLEFQYSICGEYRAFWIIAADISNIKMLMNGFYNKFKWTSSQISECGLQETLDMLFRVFHSERGRRLAKKIVDFLLEDEGCAECFPRNLIEEFKW